MGAAPMDAFGAPRLKAFCAKTPLHEATINAAAAAKISKGRRRIVIAV
jgi:hypothetical protein